MGATTLLCRPYSVGRSFSLGDTLSLSADENFALNTPTGHIYLLFTNRYNVFVQINRYDQPFSYPPPLFIFMERKSAIMPQPVANWEVLKANVYFSVFYNVWTPTQTAAPGLIWTGPWTHHLKRAVNSSDKKVIAPAAHLLAKSQPSSAMDFCKEVSNVDCSSHLICQL